MSHARPPHASSCMTLQPRRRKIRVQRAAVTRFPAFRFPTGTTSPMVAREARAACIPGEPFRTIALTPQNTATSERVGRGARHRLRLLLHGLLLPDAALLYPGVSLLSILLVHRHL